jgi:hypothetical protein
VPEPINRAAQKRVEQRNYLARKRTMEFDDGMNKQREVIYGYRNEAIDTDDPRKVIFEVIDETIPLKVPEYLTPADGEEPNYAGLLNAYRNRQAHEARAWELCWPRAREGRAARSYSPPGSVSRRLGAADVGGRQMMRRVGGHPFGWSVALQSVSRGGWSRCPRMISRPR